MKLTQWRRRPGADADEPQPPARQTPVDDRVGEGADNLQATREAIFDTLAALSAQLDGSREQWDQETRDTYDRMREEWSSCLERMDATIARVRGVPEG